ncbi:glycoside hydrolase family 16 protein [Consotaella aegiceratis]|uniref:glycoside hydrolase family 16 protein n=1 Tax=Consotaella aegiceratis TaxID=3097961 RepID=UPI002F4067ED
MPVCILLAGIGPVHAEAQINLDQFDLTFSAEFDRPSDIDEKFIHHYRRWGDLRTLAGNLEQELYVDRAYLDELGAHDVEAPFSVDDGILSITARPTPEALSGKIDLPYLSGMVTTEESFAQTNGYFEIRCRMPAGQGLWPAFWLVGLTHDEALEIDVVEVLADKPRTIYNSIHTSDRGVEWGIEVLAADSSKDFHTYGVDWRPDRIDFYVDRIMVGSAPVHLPGPMYMIANLAVGGEWPGNPTKETAFPASFEIDYIRAYAHRQ